MSARKLTRSYLHAPGKLPFIGRTVGQQLYKAADEYKDKDMYVFYADNERITFAEMKDKSQQFACSLLSIGIEKGDRLAVWGANHKEWLYATFACAQLGVILVQLRLEFPLITNQEILKKMNCKVLLLTRSPHDILDKACEIIPTLKTNDKSNLDCSSLPDLKYVIRSDNNTKASGTYSLTEFLQLGGENLRKNVEDICWTIDMDDPCLVYYTSKMDQEEYA
ncbi:medium-chain acyl-CoA ligase ACSF2, mitochondrial-like [Amphiura filiformis]|uniref:medium-chain acyl-CoA ligase ACSF2, mitochondrial-like n=1 Tax=Amphiura filiformis TaxID=82378 RepID=UPI003B210333